MSSKKCLTRVSSKSVPEEVSSKKCLTRVSSKSVPEEVSSKSALQECQVRVSYKSVK